MPAAAVPTVLEETTRAHERQTQNNEQNSFRFHHDPSFLGVTIHHCRHVTAKPDGLPWGVTLHTHSLRRAD